MHKIEKQKKKIEEAKIRQQKFVKTGTEKDEIEYATNWRRVFQDQFIGLKWLNSFASINFIAS